MNRLWALGLALSVGLNLGLLWDEWEDRRAPEPPAWTAEAPDGMPFERPAGGEPWRPGPDFVQRRLDRLADRLDLDDAQRARLGEVTQQGMDRMADRRARGEELRAAIREALASPTIDETAVRALVAEMRSEQTLLDSLVAETMLREAEALTPEQRALYFERMPWPGGDHPHGRRMGGGGRGDREHGGRDGRHGNGHGGGHR